MEVYDTKPQHEAIDPRSAVVDQIAELRVAFQQVELPEEV